MQVASMLHRGCRFRARSRFALAEAPTLLKRWNGTEYASCRGCRGGKRSMFQKHNSRELIRGLEGWAVVFMLTVLSSAMYVHRSAPAELALQFAEHDAAVQEAVAGWRKRNSAGSVTSTMPATTVGRVSKCM